MTDGLSGLGQSHMGTLGTSWQDNLMGYTVASGSLTVEVEQLKGR